MYTALLVYMHFGNEAVQRCLDVTVIPEFKYIHCTTFEGGWLVVKFRYTGRWNQVGWQIMWRRLRPVSSHHHQRQHLRYWNTCINLMVRLDSFNNWLLVLFLLSPFFADYQEYGCFAKERWYITDIDSGCQRFGEVEACGTPHVASCPDGAVFDYTVCSCQWNAEAAECSKYSR